MQCIESSNLNILKLSKAIFYLSIVLITTCCDSSSNHRFDPEKLISKPVIDSLGFGLMKSDSLDQGVLMSQGYLTFQSYQQEGAPYWVGLSASDFRLDIYSLIEKKAIRSVQFEAEGPNGITGNIDGFFYHNSDTIFILSSDANRIYLMNELGLRIDMFDFNNEPLTDGFEDYSVYANNGLQNGPYYVSSNKTLQFYTLKWYNDPNEYIDHENFASYSIEDRSFVSIYSNYPNSYNGGDNFSLYEDPTLTVVDTLSFVQFGASEYLAAYNNISGELLYVSNEHCEHWSTALEPVGSFDMRKSGDWLIEQPAYPILLHDGVSKVLYRFLKHKQPLLDNSGLLNDRWLGTWCISMYDYSLQRLGHEELPKNTLLPLYSFASSGSVWIRDIRTPLDEASLMFYRYELTNK